MDYREGRKFMKSNSDDFDLVDSDQSKGVPMPPFEDAFDEQNLIALPDPKLTKLKKADIVQVFSDRRSRRKLGAGSVSMGELSFILWATQGMREVKGGRIFRTVPSGGSRHPFETFFYADKVDGLKQGLYRYIATRNSVIPVSFAEGLKDKLSDAMMTQWFGCGVALFWVFNAYRCEWRYTGHAHKISLIDAGHVGQNAYLAAEALGMGCCGLGAYQQEEIDELLGVDGKDEFCVYIGVFGQYE